jgi:cytosine/adenosine deaminase-related metal-dependent hydrolase
MGEKMIFRAKYVVQSTKKFFEDGAVAVEDGRVTDAGKAASVAGSGRAVDFGNCAIVPGFVNTHTHLGLSALRGKAPFGGVFAEWLRALVAAKGAMTREDYLASLSAGLREAIESGTTTVGEICGDDAGWKTLAESGMRCVAFLEVIAFEKFRAPDALEALANRLDALRNFDSLNAGVAPHAPYTVSGELIARCAELAEKRGVPFAIHAAESAEEAAFLQGHEGPLGAFLRDRGVGLDEWEPPHLTPVRYLASLGALSPRSLLVHCNFLTQEEAEIIKKSGAHVIYCPRSSAFFGRADHPMRRLMDLGVNVALGTDSLASNRTLSVLDEVKFLARAHRKVFPAKFWEMATENGAAALGLGRHAGTLEKKQSADMAVISLEGCSARTPLEMALEDGARVVATIARGRVIYDALGVTERGSVF